MVVGTSRCGKTAFARRLAQALGAPRIKLDELYWGPDWAPKAKADFRRLVQAAASGLRRTISREPLFAGNRESLRGAFFSRDSILLWVITTFHRHRRDYASLRKGGEFGGLEWIELRRPSEAEAFLTDAPA